MTRPSGGRVRLRASRRAGVRIGAVAAVAAVVLVMTALPAFAHASLLSVDPQPSGVYDTSPAAVTLRFSEPVEVALGGIRVFDGASHRVDVGAPHHPDGHADQVQSSLPTLKDGTYVVTWRVTSADSHPVEGAFTFQVGPAATTTNAKGLAARLLSRQGGDTAVGVVYAIARAVLFASLALLIGGMVFLAWVYRAGRADSPRPPPRVDRLVDGRRPSPSRASRSKACTAPRSRCRRCSTCRCGAMCSTRGTARSR